MKGILFDELHSYNDLGLILSSYEIDPPSPKTNYISVPCSDGSIDLTEASGEVRFSDRNIKLTFSVIENYLETKTKVSNLLNGKKCKITFEKDEEYYYLGRCIIDTHSYLNKVGKIVISAICNPYKYKQNITTRKFVLESGKQTNVVIENGRKTVIPTIENQNKVIIEHEGGKITLKPGTHIVSNLVFKSGSNKLKLTGNGKVHFIFQEGDL